MRRTVLTGLFVALLVAALVSGCGAGKDSGRDTGSLPAGRSSAPAEVEDTAPPAPQFVQETFANRRTINYVSSDPPNNALLGAPPERVTINFSKALGAGSFIEVNRDGMKATSGQVIVAPDNRSMYVPVAAGLTGNYKVTYAAYFASGYYEEGSFGFSVKLP